MKENYIMILKIVYSPALPKVNIKIILMIEFLILNKKDQKSC